MVVPAFPKEKPPPREVVGAESMPGASSAVAETVQGFKSRGSNPKLSTVNKWQRALEAAGVEFMDEGPEHGRGVRLQKGKPAGKRK